ncbi:hypothetical protein BV898_13428 [Hypsibius exemplaris]|uniref:Uncharacterized protein n=1 Tax=Hypsibius exemplaris TaxID=2072580 RepID=A0A1W0WAW7_HYPEX|nr:hypothetical protein BV898_13428 [Hypsibius exemplaris]
MDLKVSVRKCTGCKKEKPDAHFISERGSKWCNSCSGCRQADKTRRVATKTSTNSSFPSSTVDDYAPASSSAKDGAEIQIPQVPVNALTKIFNNIEDCCKAIRYITDEAAENESGYHIKGVLQLQKEILDGEIEREGGRLLHEIGECDGHLFSSSAKRGTYGGAYCGITGGIQNGTTYDT